MSYHNRRRIIRSRVTQPRAQQTRFRPAPVRTLPVEPRSSEVDGYGNVGEDNGVLGVDYHVMPDGTVHPGANHEEYMGMMGGDEHDACLDANWINMPLGVYWNTQKIDYCERAKIHSPFYVDIVGSHWFGAADNSGNYGVDYSKCCAEIISSPCPPTDLNSPFYQFGALNPDDFCKSDYCNNTSPHVDCACCPETSTGTYTGTGNGSEEDTEDHEVKTIYSFDIDTSNVVIDGERRYFSIKGDTGAKFELEVKNSSNEYYNFRSSAMSSTRSVLIDTIRGGEYSDGINFKPIASDASETFTLTLTAITDSCAKTKHVEYKEVRFGDSKNIGEVDVNSSIGSMGISLAKTILQGPETLWTITPASGTGTSSWGGATLATHQLSTVANGIIKTSFSISATAPTNSAITLTKQPTINDFYLESTVAISAHKALEGEDQFDGESRSLVQLVGGSGGGTGTTFHMKNAIGSPVKWAIGDRITGNDELDSKIVLVNGVSIGGDHTEITVNTSVTIANSAGVYFTPPRHYRFPADNVAILRPGMRVDPTLIGTYSRSLSIPTYIEKGCDFELVDRSLPLISEPAIKATGVATFNARGEITTQAGDIIFQTPIGAEFTAASYVFQGYGIPLIESLTGSKGIKITNLKVNDGESLFVTTAINDSSATGSASLSDFDVASKNGIMDDVSTISGVNVNPTRTATVTTIASSTGKNITVTPGNHFLENGQPITFNGATTTVTITGDIEILDTGTTSRSVYLDLDRFLIIASNA